MQKYRLLAVFLVLLFCGSKSNGQVPKSWWRGENNLLDSVGTNDATYPASVGVPFQYSVGTNGQAFNFAGAAIQVQPSATLHPANITVQAWVNSTSPGTFAYILKQATVSDDFCYALYTRGALAPGGAANAVFFIRGADGALKFSANSDPNMWDGNWHQVTGTYDGTNVLVYLDGVVQANDVASAIYAGGINYTNADRLFIGKANDQLGAGGPIKGKIDDLKIFSRALSADEIMDTFTNQASSAATNSLISWWKGDGTAVDSWGGNNGTVILTNRTFDFTSGKSGKGFISQGGYVRIEDSPSIDPTNGLTMQAWVQSGLNPAGQNFRYIMSRYPDYALYTGSSGGATFFTKIESGGSAIGVTPPNVWDGAWHLLTGVHDGSSNYLYIDGVLRARAPSVGTYVFSNPLLFADAVPEEAGSLWRGKLDEVKFFDAALTDVQVLSNYVDGLGGGLVSWWRAETNALDVAGLNNGTFAAATYLSGKYTGNAFNTANGVVVIPNSASLQCSNLTIELLVRANTPGNNKSVLSKGGSYAFNTGPDGGLVFSVTTSAGTFTSPAIGASQIWNDQFQGVAGSYDGRSVRLYLNGKEVGFGTPAAGTIQYNSSELLFGDSADVPSAANFAGRIDDVRLYNVARGAKSIRDDVPTGVTFFRQPQSRIVQLGDTIKLEATSESLLSPVSYQWLHEGTNLPGATGTSLTLTNVQANQLGKYQIAVTGGSSSDFVSNVATNLTGKAFRAINYLIEVPDDPSLEIQQLTYQVWIRGAYPGDFKYIIGKNRNANDGAAVALYTTGGGLSGYLALLRTNILGDVEGPALSFMPAINSAVWDGNWHQITMTFDGTNLMNYVDGALNGSNNVLVAGNYTGVTVQYSDGTDFQGNDLVISGLFTNQLDFLKYKGDLDEVKIFGRALTPAEVTSSFTTPNSNPGGLVSWWKGDNQTASDSVGSNNGVFLPGLGFGSTLAFELSDVATLSLTPISATITGMSVATGIGLFQASVVGPDGQDFIVQTTTNLTIPTWVPVATNTVPFSFSAPLIGGSSFYRAVSGQN
jgi:hypothetical protein